MNNKVKLSFFSCALFIISSMLSTTAWEKKSAEERAADFKFFKENGFCSGCDLSGHDMREIVKELVSHRIPIRLYRSNIENTSWRKVALNDAEIQGCNASDADFSKVSIKSASFTGSDLSGAKFREARLGKIYSIDFSKTLCNNTDFSNISGIEKINFTDAEIDTANFKNTYFGGIAGWFRKWHTYGK